MALDIFNEMGFDTGILLGSIILAIGMAFMFIIIIKGRQNKKRKETEAKKTISPEGETTRSNDSEIYGRGIITIMNELNEEHLKKLYKKALEIRSDSLDEEIIEREKIIKQREEQEEPEVNKKTGIDAKTSLLNYLLHKGKIQKTKVIEHCTSKLGLSEKDSKTLLKSLSNEGKIYESGKGTIKSTE